MPYTNPPVTDDHIAIAFKNTNFGTTDYRRLLAVGVFKTMCGYSNGHTLTEIMKRLRLVGKNQTVTKRGREFVRAHPEFQEIMRKA